MDFFGKPRSRTFAPASYYRAKAPFEPNAAREAVERDARRRIRTTSTILGETRRLARGRDVGSTGSPTTGKNRPSSASSAIAAQFEVSPAHIHFGRVLPDVVVKRRATVTNVSADSGRFFVRQPACSAFFVERAPGLVSPGLTARLGVAFRATRCGEYAGEATIVTETQVFVLRLSAEVVESDGRETLERR